MATTRARPVLLAVDDCPSVHDAYRVLFEEEYQVLQAADGALALQILGSRPVDLVLLDVLMPGLDGLEVLQRIRSADRLLPVIIVSAVDSARVAVAATRLGAFDYLTKPFDADELTALARSALDHTRRAHAAGAAGDAPARVLIVSPDPGLRAAVGIILGTRISTVTDGPDAALARRAAVSPDLVVVDAPRDPEDREALLRALQTRFPAAFVIQAQRPVDVNDVLGRLPPRPGATHALRHRFSDTVRRVTQHVSVHYGQTSIQGTADALNISPSHLAHTFKAETGMTVKDYLTGVRLQVAKALLRETSGKVEAIARQVGLYDGSHLSWLLKRNGGERPAFYRRV